MTTENEKTKQELAKPEYVISSGMGGIDFHTHGWHGQQLITIAGVTGMGKTPLLLNFAINAAKLKYPVAFFSLEMSKKSVQQRLLSIISGLPLKGIANKAASKRKLEAIDELINLPIWVEEYPKRYISALEGRIAWLKDRHDINLVILDYLQLMPVPYVDNAYEADYQPEVTQEEKFEAIVKELKHMALKFHVTIIVAAQVYGDVSKRVDKVPQLYDIQGVPTLAQASDVVAFLYRPEYYGITQDNKENLAQLIIAKNRDGTTGVVSLEFQAHCGRFDDYPMED